MANTCFIPVVLSLCFLCVQSPSLPPTPSTDSSDLPYVTSEEENEFCFSEEGKPIPEGLYLRCGPGYHAQTGDRFSSPCLLCPNNDIIQTYQPKENHCIKCILCTDCAALGKEVAASCTFTSDTVCKDITPENFGGHNTTDAVVVTSPSPSTPILDVSSSTRPILQKNETDPPGCPPCIPHMEHKDKSWIVPVALAVTVLLLVFFALYKRRTYKLRISKLESENKDLRSQLEGLENEIKNLRENQGSSANQENAEPANQGHNANHVNAEIENHGNGTNNGNGEDDGEIYSEESPLRETQNDNTNSGNNGVGDNIVPNSTPTETGDSIALDHTTSADIDNGPSSTQPLLSETQNDETDSRNNGVEVSTV